MYAGSSPLIGVFGDHINAAELAALRGVLTERGWQSEVLHWNSLPSPAALRRYSALWYHRTDTAAADAAETGATRQITAYVRDGGHLLLTMEAVPLLNAWHMESGRYSLREDTIRDEGFGRPLGFHGYRSHPVFDSLQGGGVYCSKQPVDHIARKWGLFGADTPREGRVIGIQWTYITFGEHSRLLLEYHPGKGTVIAAGAYMYYSAPNYNRVHLARLTQNIFMYMDGRLTGPRKYWSTAPRTVAPAGFAAPAQPLTAAKKWTLPKPSLQLPAKTGSRAFYDLTGRRIAWMGRLDGGAEEIWTHPLMALRDLAVGVRLKDRDSVSWLKNLQPEVLVTPEYLIRTYHIGTSSIREIYTVSFDRPCGVAHIEPEGAGITGLVVRYGCNLRLMWPYSAEAAGSIRYGFCPAANAHIISGGNDAASTVVAYSARPLRQEMRTVNDSGQVDVSAEFALSGTPAIDIRILGGETGWKENLRLYRSLCGEMSRLFDESGRYYRKLLEDHLTFTTPDTAFNEGYRWALARTDQFLQTTPGVGTALMAGFGTTSRGWDGGQKPSGRPGYAWYFGRDGEWSAMAVDAYGDPGMVRKMLETLIRYQDVSGKIYHELSSSGAVHYDASDATPLFVVLAAHYLRYSGDTLFIRRNWPAIRKAMDFCYSTDTDGDGLIENTNVGHGWIEGGVLYGTHTEFYLAASWAAALEGAARMAQCTGYAGDARRYAGDARRVRETIDREFWNPNEQFFYNGKMKDGSYMQDPTVLAAVAVYLRTVQDSAKAAAVSDRMAGSAFSTDWGIRMIESTNPHYRAGSYHAGMVWPLYAGWASLADFRTGRYANGYTHLMNNLLHYRNWSPGSIEETFNGDKYVPNGVCSHQCWSEAMVPLPAIEGMLGLDVDVPPNRYRLAPWFPRDWKFARVTQIPLNRSHAALDMQRTPGRTVYTITCPAARTILFEPAFPLGTQMSAVRLDGAPIPAETLQGAEGITLKCRLRLSAGRHRLEVRHSGGIGALPIVALPQPGDSSTGLRILTQRLDGDQYTVTLEGRGGSSGLLKIYTAQAAGHIENAAPVSGNAAPVSGKDGVLTLQVNIPADRNRPYSRLEVRLRITR
ncbi:amylo-alpha-1,6-glucosidase [Puia sp. P3]|uniref:amylo-alpha-1,6-glucosidase n=1 Tax=Puia sp. P3 TaxID=3423952 RepID=UPI003D6656EA